MDWLLSLFTGAMSVAGAIDKATSPKVHPIQNIPAAPGSAKRNPAPAAGLAGAAPSGPMAPVTAPELKQRPFENSGAIEDFHDSVGGNTGRPLEPMINTQPETRNYGADNFDKTLQGYGSADTNPVADISHESNDEHAARLAEVGVKDPTAPGLPWMGATDKALGAVAGVGKAMQTPHQLIQAPVEHTPGWQGYQQMLMSDRNNKVIWVGNGYKK